MESSKKVLYVLKGDTGLEKEIWFSDEETNQKMVESKKEVEKNGAVAQRKKQYKI
ncbi:MAG: hypothetical protein HFG52_12570 [Lachnospiraceae bacterium]|nr:hypothetical protein [Lachnospiraceae bacterium]